ncbi:gh3 auxin-responsive promoter [Leptolyngbya sp. Heron Island J]|uniref:GH3 family domain-containing protein n=1 Tax=Leptolyngbya sp. Heron Island J TaxID=1385935 RepID=UPI0003B948CB|nr:GH3 auxin-responsive promoter family protein [Leptolyngbya sp. Heron Island J]ESA35279.1 gh3 auxin-responsive promoter [Leptolyngbya sp. Heron Island J]
MGWLIQGFNALLAPTARRFRQALSQPQVAQQTLQRSLVRRLTQCDYGQSLGITSVEDWHKLPIVTYEELQSWIAAQKSLTPEPILFYEQTSGSSGPAKRIPYTRSLRKSFNTLFCLWAHDLITHGPQFKTGKLYMCISPKLLAPGESHTGLQDDSEYLDPWLRWLLSRFLVGPANAHRPQRPEVFQANLCTALLRAENLETISIWSPSFLRVQLDYIQTHRQTLQSQLKGQLSPERSRFLSADKIDWEALWPQLKLISCWDSAIAADQVSSLKSQFPQTLIQGKGLLATEAPMTVPLIAAKGCVPLITEVFFEFEDDAGQIYQLHELELGKIYSVIISQKGGLYRYRMGDRIRPTHYYQATPCLQFLGRSHSTSDMVGEKLTLDFVRQIFHQLNLPSHTFKCLVPSLYPQPQYSLLLDQAGPPQLATALEQLLCNSFHYRQARLLGQLQPAQVYDAPDMPQRLMQYHYHQGKRLGDVKYPYLLTTPIDITTDTLFSNICRSALS